MRSGHGPARRWIVWIYETCSRRDLPSPKINTLNASRIRCQRKAFSARLPTLQQDFGSCPRRWHTSTALQQGHGVSRTYIHLRFPESPIITWLCWYHSLSAEKQKKKVITNRCGSVWWPPDGWVGLILSLRRQAVRAISFYLFPIPKVAVRMQNCHSLVLEKRRRNEKGRVDDFTHQADNSSYGLNHHDSWTFPKSAKSN